MHFTQLPTDTMLAYLRRIATDEGYALSDERCRSVVRLSNGNLRRALTLLQIVAESNSSDAHPLDLDTLEERMDPKGVSELLQLALQNEAPKARQVLDRLLLETGLSGSEILTQMRAHVRGMRLPEEVLAKLLITLGNADYARLQGLNERIQLEALVYNLAYEVPRATTVSN